ncbi:hypothetical protein HKX54_09770 [Sulfitobacter sp. M57]|uniref:hypothetical protein n=1 Tax=unclassified Sulfitobacter TaxID=196795 RepID=UPI0023E2A2AC|nr:MULTISPECIES: hypothetical protein [unclassified Sulfitobacter]MDF3414741.1 hypothetical protein [Sulfitobacter sp. KE5]MDF3422222.1 hypothetical protein [Sulfitobacter sp. KE43]MDF3433287.1 hypothetical protein [Sulfitobacter sp. KE42]MDF3458927.1 hypothetical protein [Sulfitobacter sp. S74]MDF3462826.1 hypothetical protein [Sulfitobacter sp. Ks18]
MFTRIFLALTFSATAVVADPPKIEAASARKAGSYWTFDVTLKHADTGWEHYADAWRVVDKDGNELGLRNLAHPHVNEQPFTRSLSGVEIPADIKEVGIQARDNTTGWGSAIKRIKLR